MPVTLILKVTLGKIILSHHNETSLLIFGHCDNSEVSILQEPSRETHGKRHTRGKYITHFTVIPKKNYQNGFKHWSLLPIPLNSLAIHA